MRSRARLFLIAAVSGRALAASARRGGRRVVVLDFFNDLDTRSHALRSRAVAESMRGFDPEGLVAAAEELCPPGSCAGLVYGSGFESRPELLARLAQGRRLMGNPPETLERFKDPSWFFPLLDRIGITHPQVSLDPPPDPDGWLAKKAGGAGGGHVLPAAQALAAYTAGESGYYYQRRVQGRICSVLFLANGRKARVIGFNEQWTAPVAGSGPYCYGGAASRARLGPKLRREVAWMVERLVRETGLIGLNGIDFIVDGKGDPQVLEVNPRPTATLDLYDADCTEGLFALHLAACNGRLPEGSPVRAGAARAHAIVYAPQAVRVSQIWRWPRWCSDLPSAGSSIAAGAPVCTVHSRAQDPQAAWALAQRRRERIHQALMCCPINTWPDSGAGEREVGGEGLLAPGSETAAKSVPGSARADTGLAPRRGEQRRPAGIVANSFTGYLGDSTLGRAVP